MDDLIFSIGFFLDDIGDPIAIIKFFEYSTRTVTLTDTLHVRILTFSKNLSSKDTRDNRMVPPGAEIDDTSALFDDSNTRLEILSRHFPLLHDSSILSGWANKQIALR